MRHSDESCSSPAGANAGSFDNQKVFINCYAYSKMPEIMLIGTHMHKILSSPGKPCPSGGWCYTTIILPGFDIYVPGSGQIPVTMTVMLDLPQRKRLAVRHPLLGAGLGFVCFCLIFFFFLFSPLLQDLKKKSST